MKDTTRFDGVGLDFIICICVWEFKIPDVFCKQSTVYISDLFNESQSNRSRTPTPDRHGQNNLDDPNKTPTPDNQNQGHFNDSSRNGPGLNNSRTPFNDVQNTDFHKSRKEYTPEIKPSRDINFRQEFLDARREGGSHTTYRQEYNRLDDQREFARFGSEPPRREYRSRTPGPEIMNRHPGPDQYYRSKTPNPGDMRSKTPTLDYLNISGTPDFIPASRYQVPQKPYPSPNVPYGQNYGNSGYHSRTSSHSGHDMQYGAQYPNHPADNRLHSPKSYQHSPNYPANRNYDYNPYNQHPAQRGFSQENFSSHSPGSKPRKQSTSFENAEPSPSSLTKVPRFGGKGGSYSPAASPGYVGPLSRDEDWLEMTVTLHRQESGFGFRIIGGTEEGSQVRESNSTQKCVYKLHELDSVFQISPYIHFTYIHDPGNE